MLQACGVLEILLNCESTVGDGCSGKGLATCHDWNYSGNREILPVKGENDE